MRNDLGDFLVEVRRLLGEAPPPAGLAGRVRALVAAGSERPAMADLGLRPVAPPPSLASGVRMLVLRQQRTWRLRRAAGVSMSTAAAAFLLVAHLGWGFVRDSFRGQADLASQSARVERSHETGLTGGVNDLSALLENDPFEFG
ncbi:hypothetical protein IIA16_02600 [bacterium]|nr:hypothetical protein [bacterium]